MQQRRRSKLGMLRVVVFGLTLGFLGPQVTHARSVADDCIRLVVGTYLTTFTNIDIRFTGRRGTGVAFLSRSLLTLSNDGTLLSIDSSQGGVEGVFNPFTHAQGSWQCTGKQTFIATSLNFTLAGSEGSDLGIARLDYRAIVDQETQAIKGTTELRFFPLRGNPLTDEVELSGAYSFVGQRIP